jgi:hypothetical protein
MMGAENPIGDTCTSSFTREDGLGERHSEFLAMQLESSKSQYNINCC